MSHAFFWTALKRFCRAQVLQQPTGHLYAALRPTLEGSTDEELAALLAAAPFRRFLKRLPDGRTFVADFTRPAPLPGQTTVPTLAVLQLEADGRLSVVSILAHGITVTPAKPRAWALAKQYVLQGATGHLALAAAA